MIPFYKKQSSDLIFFPDEESFLLLLLRKEMHILFFALASAFKDKNSKGNNFQKGHSTGVPTINAAM